MRRKARAWGAGCVGGVAVGTAGSSAYLLVLLAAAARSARNGRGSSPGAPTPNFVVLVPAHDEEQTIEAAVANLRAQRYTGSFEVIVVADNCRDSTAHRAVRAGATVWERHAPDQRGKGQALAWGIEQVEAERPDAEAIAMVDADCLASPNFLEASASRIAAGAKAVQVSYGVSNPDASSTAAARYAGFALINHVRPLGKSALGLSSGLLGSGMAFDTALLSQIPWRSFGVTEDSEFHLHLVEDGVRVEFAPEAYVVSAMPKTAAGAEVQRERWEGGKWQLARRWTGPLLSAGLRRRDLNSLHSALELWVLPQSLILAGGVGVTAGAAVLHFPRVALIGAAGVVGQVVFVIGGLALYGAPKPVYRSLAVAPLLAARNAATYARIASRRTARGWVRTPRQPAG